MSDQAKTTLRQQAEARLREQKSAVSGQPSAEETRQALHELQVHQIELEMQNEELRRAQAKLDVSRARYFNLYDLAPAAYFTVSDQGLILEANLTAVTLLGAAKGALVARPFSQFIFKPSQDRYYLFRRQLLASHQPQVCGDLQIVKPDGTQFWGELQGKTETDETGATLFQLILSDSTARRQTEEKLRQDIKQAELNRETFLGVLEDQQQAEAALRQSQSLLQSVTEGTSDAIYVKDLQGRYLMLNAAMARIVGKPGEEVLGQDDTALFPPDEARQIMESDRRVMASGSVQTYEELVTSGGVTRTFLSAKGPVRDAQGKVSGLFSVARDITDRKQAEAEIRELNQTLEQRVVERTAQLQAANQELEGFSYSVSHDLRSPLRAIDGFARILVEEQQARLDDDGRRLLGTICGEAQRMGQLIDDLLAFSRMSRQAVETKEIDLAALAQAVFDEQVAHAPGRQIQFQVQPLPPAQGDRAMLRQVLTNLISNAIKYTRPRAVAEIEVGFQNAEPGMRNADGQTEESASRDSASPPSAIRHPPSAVVYFVRDNGVGFNMKYADKLFGVFQRLHTESEFEGTGVGLALVQRVIHRHGGRVWAESKLNEGSTFYFTMPIGKQ